MAQFSLSLETSAYYNDSIKFVNIWKEKYQWKDLSEDVFMDIGCGDELNCCKAIMVLFPDVKAVIAVDKESTVFQTAHFRHKKIQFCVGDIQERDSLKSHEGQMNKVISMNTFDEIIDKEMAFRNVYHLLKPGGEAGFFFCLNSCLHKFLSVLSEIPKYGARIEDTYAMNMFALEHGVQYYKELLEKIGFKHVRAFDEDKGFEFLSDECFKDVFLEDIKINLEVSPEGAEMFEAEMLELYERTFGRYEGKLCYLSVHLNLYGVKPMQN